MGEFRPLVASYDDLTDVLYLAVERPSDGVRYQNDVSGILVRVKKNGEPVGITIEDFHYAWDNRIEFLIETICRTLHVAPDEVREMLPR